VPSGTLQLFGNSQAVEADQNSFAGGLSGAEDGILDAPLGRASAPAIPGAIEPASMPFRGE
jgi:hypothetical protein